MRLIKVVHLGLGLAASGGAVLVLSGSALADSGAASATQVSQAPAVTLPATGSDVTNSGSSTVTISKSSTLGPTVTKSGNDVNSSIGKGDPTDTSGTSKASGDDKTNTTSKSSDDSQTPKADGQTSAAADVTPSLTAPAPLLPASPSGGSSEVQIVRVIRPAVEYHSTWLPIQPTITSHATPVNSDLAAAMPSAPTPAKAPLPEKPNGALGTLRTALAGSVVPQPFFPPVSMVATLMLGSALLTMTLLLGAIFRFSYGLWLRRGGFATAARSDVPTAATIFSPFATPLLLGYVSMPPRLHSPLLVAVGNRSLTLLERRICI
jgi:hypothetical protein